MALRRGTPFSDALADLQYQRRMLDYYSEKVRMAEQAVDEVGGEGKNSPGINAPDLIDDARDLQETADWERSRDEYERHMGREW